MYKALTVDYKDTLEEKMKFRPRFLPIYHYNCHICGTPVEKHNKTATASCFDCKQERRRKTAIKRYHKLKKMKKL